jgi:hypothetical protein
VLFSLRPQKGSTLRAAFPTPGRSEEKGMPVLSSPANPAMDFIGRLFGLLDRVPLFRPSPGERQTKPPSNNTETPKEKGTSLPPLQNPLALQEKVAVEPTAPIDQALVLLFLAMGLNPTSANSVGSAGFSPFRGKRAGARTSGDPLLT